jgi:DmsE family decaheme c-type cytochrome
LIIDPATATAKVVDEKCMACHGGRHVDFERSSHAKGNVSCIGCHSIHSAAAPKHLLKKAQPELCYQCHKEIKAQFSMPFRHKVAEGLIQCTDCHDAHGADRESQRHTYAWQVDVCAKCHAAAAGPFVHEHAAIKAEGCTACHFPHGGANPKLMTQANVNTICLQCHSPSLNSMTGQPAAPTHGHSAQGQSCISCHTGIHGSNVSEVFLNSTQEKSDR